MTKYSHMHVIAVAISTLTTPGFAQETEPAVVDGDRASLIRATQIMRKIDLPEKAGGLRTRTPHRRFARRRGMDC